MGCCGSTESDNESQDFVATLKPIRNRSSKWNIDELLAESQKIDQPSARNIVHLFENQNTIPFICRYRRDLISPNITPDKLRDIKNAYIDIVDLRKRAETIISQLEDEQVNMTDEIREQFLCAKTMKELEFLHANYKIASRDVHKLGLEIHAYRLLIGDKPPVQLKSIINQTNPDLNTIEKVKDGICRIISLHISTQSRVIHELHRLQKIHKIVLKSTKTEVANENNDPDSSTAMPITSDSIPNGQSKYELYFNFTRDVRSMKPHQVLAINRGERLKVLLVEIIVPPVFQNSIRSFVRCMFMSVGMSYTLRNAIFEEAFDECYTQKLRDDLTEMAKKSGLEVFAKNLKQLLLMPPLKGERILGIDPGFKNGCKLALISETAALLEVGVLYLHNKHSNEKKCGIKLANMLSRHRCKIIALGNGTACRETESWIMKLFEYRILDPECVQYTIVSEQGASFYSCSKLAIREFPKLDPKLISAVSIARRLNDPLSEYVKIEPRHLGVGMYQHDINKEFLSQSVNEVVSECVSFVGVDINTASLSLLTHIAGLDGKLALNIIQHRQRTGPFRTRRDLLQVKTVGQSVFQQCAGFIRIEPKSVGGQIDNILDCTWVHPESYTVAIKIINQCGLNLKDIGKPEFISKIKTFAESYPPETVANHHDIPTERLQSILEALQRQIFQDYRPAFDMKLFKKGITQFEDLFIGEIVTGQVRNIVHFGAFVDIGVKRSALIHKTQMNGIKLKVGDRVSTSVIDIDIPRKLISLRLDELIFASK